MTLAEFITLTKEGSLAQTKVTQDSIISFTNLAIQVISDEFDLLSKIEVVTLSAYVTEYDLPNDFESMYFINTPGVYWRDLQGNIFPRIDSFEVGVNVQGSYNSIFISDNLVFTAPYPITGQPLTLDYKATPSKISNLSSKLPLASQYNSVLMLYVTYLGFQQALGASHADTMTAFKAYSVGVDSLRESGTFVNAFGFNNKFNERGFV
jgi:hypothetical protein